MPISLAGGGLGRGEGLSCLGGRRITPLVGRGIFSVSGRGLRLGPTGRLEKPGCVGRGFGTGWIVALLGGLGRAPLRRDGGLRIARVCPGLGGFIPRSMARARI